MKPIITKTTQPTRFPVARVLIKACIILSTVALSLLLISCPDEAQPGKHIELSPLYTCANGTAEAGASPTTTEPPTELCTRCNQYYVLDGTTCVAQTSPLYTCRNGTAETGTTNTPTPPTERCAQCNAGYIIDTGTSTCVIRSTLSFSTTQVTFPATGSAVPSIIVADFESPQALLDAGWFATGDFANPATIDSWVGTSLPSSDAGFIGQRSFNSCQPGAGSTCPEEGTLISPPVPVTHRYLNFLIAGTPGEDHIAVIILDSEDDYSDLDDSTNDIARIQPLYSTPEYISSDFDWRSIDLESEMTEADNNIRIIIRDEGEGSINVDHFFFSDRPWGLRQDEWSNPRPSFLGDSSTAISDSTYIRLHTGGFDPATGQPAALFGGFDDASILSTDDGWEYSDGFVAQDASAPAPAGLAGHFGDAQYGRIGVYPISTCIAPPGICPRATDITITSPAFPVTARYLNFLLVGGSRGERTTSVTFDGTDTSNADLEFRLFAGDNDAAAASQAVLRMAPQGCVDSFYSAGYGGEELWHSIDVSAYMNQTLRFQLIDNSSADCHAISVDHMYFSDVPVSRSNIRGTLSSASPDTTPPGLVTNLRAAQNAADGAQVVWTEPFDSDLANILLSWVPAEGDQTSPLTVAAGTRTATITGLTAGTEYSFTAVSVDNAATPNMSAASESATVTIDGTAPATPTALTASAIINGHVSLSWTNPTDADFSHAVLTWMPTHGDQTSPLAIRRGGTRAVITGLSHGTQYSFTIAAVDVAGNVSSASAAQTATSDSSVSPITALTATPGDTSIALSWTAPTDSDFASVTITWDPAGGTTTQPLSVATGTAAASITGLTNGTAYTVSVVAIDTLGHQSTVVEATATPVAP